MHDNLLYTVPEVAELLKVNTNKVYDLIRAGLLTSLKLGRYKVPRTEVIKFVEAYKGKDLTDLNNIKDIDNSNNFHGG
jgi:excisionase family DNA binding protein